MGEGNVFKPPSSDDLVMEGAYGKVYLLTNKDDEKLALKVIPIYDETDEMKLAAEKDITMKISGPNGEGHVNMIRTDICWVEEYDASHKKRFPFEESVENNYRTPTKLFFMRMEYGHTNLFKWCIANPTKNAIGDIIKRWKILLGISRGLAHMHSKGITHRDLKPENIILTTAANGEDVPKIIDFGLSQRQWEGNGYDATYGTIKYMPPEQRGVYINSQSRLATINMRPLRVEGQPEKFCVMYDDGGLDYVTKPDMILTRVETLTNSVDMWPFGKIAKDLIRGSCFDKWRNPIMDQVMHDRPEDRMPAAHMVSFLEEIIHEVEDQPDYDPQTKLWDDSQ